MQIYGFNKGNKKDQNCEGWDRPILCLFLLQWQHMHWSNMLCAKYNKVQKVSLPQTYLLYIWHCIHLGHSRLRCIFPLCPLLLTDIFAACLATSSTVDGPEGIMLSTGKEEMLLKLFIVVEVETNKQKKIKHVNKTMPERLSPLFSDWNCHHILNFHYIRETKLVCLVGFLTSSSTTRLYRGRAPRQSVWQFNVLPHMRQSWETMILSQPVTLYWRRPNQ